MALSTCPDTVQVQVKQLYLGKFLENVWNFRSTVSEVNPTTIATLNATIMSWVVDEYLSKFVTAWTLTELQSTSLDFTAPYEIITTFPVTGEVAEEGMPVNVAVETTFVTGLIGRSFKGRGYSSAHPKSAFSGNTYETIPATALLLAWQALATALITEEWEHVVVSRQQDLVTIDPAVATKVVLYSVNPLVRDMGRRLNNS